jgi:hypothetical protein
VGVDLTGSIDEYKEELNDMFRVSQEEAIEADKKQLEH